MARVKTLRGNDDNNYWRGGRRDERVLGYGGDDDIGGGGGDDLLFGGDGNDMLDGGTGNDVLSGGRGIDAVNYQGARTGTVVDLKAGTATDGLGGTDMLSGIEVVLGGRYDDMITGSDGNDDLRGASGDDVLRGGAGDDILRGGSGWDRLEGGEGRDYADYFYASGSVRVDLSVGFSFGADGSDRLFSIEGVHGSRYDDELIAAPEGSHLLGWAGNDVLRGGAGDDDLAGGEGGDVLTGGAGKDVLYGGEGADTFVFGPFDTGTTVCTADVIADFCQGSGDVIDLSGIDARPSCDGDQAFTFIGDAAFSGQAGELRAYACNGQTFVEGDVDGDGVLDGMIVLTGELCLTECDFKL